MPFVHVSATLVDTCCSSWLQVARACVPLAKVVYASLLTGQPRIFFVFLQVHSSCFPQKCGEAIKMGIPISNFS